MALLDRAIVSALPAVPKPIVRRISQRYIAGETVEDACRVVEALNAAGKMATIDVLGEEITTPEEARHIAYAYDDVFRVIQDRQLDSNVSVKLTGLGLKLGLDVARRNLERTVRGAAELGNFVRIDMEDSSCTDDTLALYRELREQGLDNVGVVLQARLRRTQSDIEALADLRPNVRLCKGIYVEPLKVAYQDFDQVRASFVAVARHPARARLLRRDRDPRRMAALRGRAARPAARPRAGRNTSSRCSSACGRPVPTSSSRRDTGCGSTSPSASSGTRTRSAASRRTRRSPATSPRTRSAG